MVSDHPIMRRDSKRTSKRRLSGTAKPPEPPRMENKAVSSRELEQLPAVPARTQSADSLSCCQPAPAAQPTDSPPLWPTGAETSQMNSPPLAASTGGEAPPPLFIADAQQKPQRRLSKGFSSGKSIGGRRGSKDHSALLGSL